MWTMQWKDNESHAVASAEELTRMLDGLVASHGKSDRVLVQVKAPTGEVLMIGVGGDSSVLDYIAAGGWPAKHSVGDATAAGSLPFRMGSYDSEMPAAYAIPYSLARKAAGHFFTTGQLLSDVTWEDD